MIPILSTLFAAFSAPPADDAGRLERIENMYSTYRVVFPKVEGITATELRALREKGAPLVLIDVRPIEERQVSTIPGALPEESVDVAALAGKEVVTFCTIGARSGAYAVKLRKEGVHVRNLEGSLLAWTHVGGELVDADGKPTQRLHVYGKRWNLAAAGYVPVISASGGGLQEL